MRMNVRQLRQHYIARELDRFSSELARNRHVCSRRRCAIATDKRETRAVETIITARINLVEVGPVVRCEVCILDARTANMIEEDPERSCYVLGLARPREITMTCFCELLQQRVIRITSQPESKNARGARVKGLQDLFHIPRTQSGIAIGHQDNAALALRKLRRELDCFCE